MKGVAEPLSRIPELNAPAGRRETFFAALDAGADAVYLGLKKFNARLKSENFTIAELARLIPFAHERGKKVYVALNTLLKQTELHEAVSLLPALAGLGADAVIIADLGLAAVARARFPGIRLHLSTQAGVHSSAGAAAAERLGCSRVILARELTRGELALVRKRTALELEVFVHGALCWSLSGFCLASSFIGGRSGNRGLCTQVCRRAFAATGAETSFFSLRDLSLLEFVPDFAALGVDALKIEGRLKGVSYVRAVVSAFRRAIDASQGAAGLTAELVADFARKKTSYFYGLGERTSDEAILGNESGTGAVGVPLGEAIRTGENSLTVRTPVAIEAGDAIRIQPASGFEGKRHRLAAVREEGGNIELIFHHPVASAPGDRIYLVEKRRAPAGVPQSPPRLPSGAEAQDKHWKTLSLEKARRLIDGLLPGAPGKPGPVSYSLKIDSLDWIDPIAVVARDAARLIVSVDIDAGRRLIQKIPGLSAGLRKNVTAGFPLFIPETRLDAYRRLARGLKAAGVHSFWAENLGAFAISSGAGGSDEANGADGAGARFIAAPSVNALNAQARALLREIGADIVCYPLEDDFLNIRNSRRVPAAIVAYGFVPLFISRVDPGIGDGTVLRDRNGNEFTAARRAGCSFLLAKEPVCLFQKRDKLEALGVRHFILDLCFIPPSERFLREVLAAFREKRRLLPSSLFNFKRELA